MNDLLISLVGGAALNAVAIVVLLRLSTLGAYQSAGIVGLVSSTVYLLMTVVFWPGADVLALHLAIYWMTCYGCGVLLGWRPSPSAPAGSGPAFIVGFFIVLAAVDALFIVLATQGLSTQFSTLFLPKPRSEAVITTSFPGLITHDFQQKEALFNAYLEERQRQQKRGWQIQAMWLNVPRVQQPATLQVVAMTRENQPLHQAHITGQWVRPSDSRLDQTFVMTEKQAGIYQHAFYPTFPGRWELIIHVSKDNENHEIRASTFIKP